MVEAVLHNACLRLEDWGSSLDDVMRAKTRKRWFGRSGLVVGGAASLAVGAVLGGVLEGVPVLFPPTTGATSLPHATSDSAGTLVRAPAGLAGFDQASGSAQAPAQPIGPGAAQAAQEAQAASSDAQSPVTTGASGVAPGSAGATSTSVPGSGGSSGSPSGGSVSSGGGTATDTGAPGSSSPLSSLPVPAPAPQVEDSLGQVLNTLSGATSGLPVVGQTASSTLGTAGSVAEQASGAASSVATTPAPVTTTSSPVSSASSPLPGVTSGASSSLGGL